MTRRLTRGFTDAQLRIVRFCAIECELQMSGERSVHRMVDAWQLALSRANKIPTIDDVLGLGAIIDPRNLLPGWRQVGVRVGWDVKMRPELVPQAMENVAAAFARLSAAEAFREFEEIHPFVDGNGRTGQILYNWLRGSLGDPEWAPNFWNDARREPNDGAPAYVESAVQ